MFPRLLWWADEDRAAAWVGHVAGTSHIYVHGGGGGKEIGMACTLAVFCAASVERWLHESNDRWGSRAALETAFLL